MKWFGHLTVVALLAGACSQGTATEGAGGKGTGRSATGTTTGTGTGGPSLDGGAVCTPGMDQTCNDVPVMSALAGVCQADGTCRCGPRFVKKPSGKCGP
jgi:hypothetical protein